MLYPRPPPPPRMLLGKTGGLWQALEEARAFRDSLVDSLSRQIAKQQQQLIQQQHKINVLQQQIQVTRGQRRQSRREKGWQDRLPLGLMKKPYSSSNFAPIPSNSGVLF